MKTKNMLRKKSIIAVAIFTAVLLTTAMIAIHAFPQPLFLPVNNNHTSNIAALDTPVWQESNTAHLDVVEKAVFRKTFTQADLPLTITTPNEVLNAHNNGWNIKKITVTLNNFHGEKEWIKNPSFTVGGGGWSTSGNIVWGGCAYSFDVVWSIYDYVHTYGSLTQTVTINPLYPNTSPNIATGGWMITSYNPSWTEAGPGCATVTWDVAINGNTESKSVSNQLTSYYPYSFSLNPSSSYFSTTQKNTITVDYNFDTLAYPYAGLWKKTYAAVDWCSSHFDTYFKPSNTTSGDYAKVVLKDDTLSPVSVTFTPTGWGKGFASYSATSIDPNKNWLVTMEGLRWAKTDATVEWQLEKTFPNGASVGFSVSPNNPNVNWLVTYTTNTPPSFTLDRLTIQNVPSDWIFSGATCTGGTPQGVTLQNGQIIVPQNNPTGTYTFTLSAPNYLTTEGQVNAETQFNNNNTLNISQCLDSEWNQIYVTAKASDGTQTLPGTYTLTLYEEENWLTDWAVQDNDGVGVSKYLNQILSQPNLATYTLRAGYKHPDGLKAGCATAQLQVSDDDTQPPTVTSYSAGDTTDAETTAYNLYAEVSDPSGIALNGVLFRYRFGNGNWSAWVTGTPQGNTYVYSIPRTVWIQHVGETVSFQVNATDNDNDRPGDNSWTIVDGPIHLITDDDATPPSITPLSYNVSYDRDLVAWFTITDDSGLQAVWLDYEVVGGTQPIYGSVNYTAKQGNDYKFVVPDQWDYGYTINLNITAIDNDLDRAADQLLSIYSDSLNVSDDTPLVIYGPTTSGDILDTYTGQYILQIHVYDEPGGSGVQEVKLKYRWSGNPSDWSSLPWYTPTHVSGDLYEYRINRSEWIQHVGETLEWYIEATDNANNLATYGPLQAGTISDDDTSPPELEYRNPPETPHNVESNLNLTVSFQVCDQSPFPDNAATIHYRWSHQGQWQGDWQSATMTRMWQSNQGGLYHAEFRHTLPAPGDAKEGWTLYYYVTCWDGDADRSGDQLNATYNNGGNYYALVIVDDDTQPPVISNPQHSGNLDDSPENTLYTISVEVQDDSGVASVLFRYRFGNGNWSAWMEHTRSEGPRYYYDIPRTVWIQHVGETVSFQVNATDNDNTPLSTTTTTIAAGMILDDDNAPPSIGSPSYPQMREYYEDLVVTVGVSDDSGVTSCILFYSVNMGAETSVNMTFNGISWSATIPASAYGYGDLVSFYIVAYDGDSDRPNDSCSASSMVYYATITDSEPPSVDTPVRTGQNYYEQPLISVNVSEPPDASGIKEVNLLYQVDGGTWYIMPMYLSNDVWVASIPSQPYSSTVNYRVRAQDNAGNTYETPVSSYVVSDDLPPEFQGYNSSYTSGGVSVTFYLTIHEPDEASGVQEVTLLWNNDNGSTWYAAHCTRVQGDVWTVTLNGQGYGKTVYFKVNMSDKAGNVAITQVYSEDIVNTPPQILDVYVSTTNTTQGATVYVTAKLYDVDWFEENYLLVRRPDSTTFKSYFTYVSSEDYWYTEFTLPRDAPTGEYVMVLHTKDSYGLENTTTLENLTVNNLGCDLDAFTYDTQTPPGGNFTLEVWLSDPDGVSNASCVLIQGNTSLDLGYLTHTGDHWTLTCTLPENVGGSYDVVVVTLDGAGVQRNHTLPYRLDIMFLTHVEMGDFTVCFSDTLSFNATLLDENNTRLADMTIVLSYRLDGGEWSVFATVTTNDQGDALKDILVTLQPGVYQIRAQFNGHDLYAPSEAVSTLTVLKENTVVNVPSPEIQTGLATLTGTIFDDDGTPLNSRLTLYLQGTQTIPLGSTWAEGGSWSITINVLSLNIPYGSYTLLVVVDGGQYYHNNTQASVSVRHTTGNLELPDSLQLGEQGTFQLDAQDPDGVQSVTCELVNPFGVSVEVPVTLQDGVWTADWTPAAQAPTGAWRVVFTATDGAGHSTSFQGVLVVEKPQLQVSVTLPSSVRVGQPFTVTLTLTYETGVPYTGSVLVEVDGVITKAYSYGNGTYAATVVAYSPGSKLSVVVGKDVVQSSKISAQTDSSQLLYPLLLLNALQTFERQALVVPVAVSLLAASVGVFALLIRYLANRLRGEEEEPDVFEVARKLDDILFPSEKK